jgi:hypothetical protein
MIVNDSSVNGALPDRNIYAYRACRVAGRRS